VHTLPLLHDTGSAGSAPPAAAAGSSMPHGHARGAVATQAAMLAAGGPSLPAPLRKPSAAAPTAGLAVSTVPRGARARGGGSSGSGSRGSPREMKPPAARLSKPASGAIVKPLRPAQVQRKRSGVEEALQAAAVEAQESKVRHCPVFQACWPAISCCVKESVCTTHPN
jgi:hypothetical protein